VALIPGNDEETPTLLAWSPPLRIGAEARRRIGYHPGAKGVVDMASGLVCHLDVEEDPDGDGFSSSIRELPNVIYESGEN
jgi:hypothetical protein